jgi:predicted DNA-binding protein
MFICAFVVLNAKLFEIYEIRKGNLMRLSIEVTQEQHQRLKAISALRGQSIKDYVLERVFQPLPEVDAANEDEALRQLEAFLKPRVEAAEQGVIVNKSVQQIFEETHQEEL